jgi:alkanesulfonate monooxygenase SsuD/methylene tetrahydromethanopterin reductase-like flavin-dependent oxidoreductase (luciferase family)
LPWHDLVLLAQTVERTGYEAVFVPEIDAREAFGTLAGLASVTDTVRLGTGVVTVGSRRPFTAAMAAATLQELSGGRFILGIGSGPVRSLARVREYVGIVRRALAGEPVEDEGRERRLSLGGSPPPIFLGALGGAMIALAGEIADGVLLNWCTPERVRRARNLVAEGARRAGRDPAQITVGVYVRACLGEEEGVALEALRWAAAQYLAFPHYRRQFEAMGLVSPPDGSAGRPPFAEDALVRSVCLLGEPSAAGDRLDQYRAAGADLPLVYPVPVLDPSSSLMGTVLALAPTPALEG